MSVLLILNELSLNPVAPNKEIARERVQSFLKTIRAACRAGIKRELRTQENFKECLIATGYTWRNWNQDSEVPKEERQYFLGMATRSPYLNGLGENQNESVGFEFTVNGVRAEGLGIAFITGGLAVSLLSEENWDSAGVEVGVSELIDDGTIREFSKIVPHASRDVHIDNIHRKWIHDRLAKSVFSGEELWKESSIFFPSLDFCPAVETQMAQLPKEALAPILRGLFCLETYCQGWTDGGFNQNSLGCASSTESKSTKATYGKERTFLCPNGVERVFSYHVKPGQSWRIYYDPDPGPGRMYIGYVGRHLPTTRHNH
ncbi:MAG: hypothetical protein HQL75_08225 [Magnetococcales bacterium]|nr:hypothetical protein [Magnetococcales bacterium]